MTQKQKTILNDKQIIDMLSKSIDMSAECLMNRRLFETITYMVSSTLNIMLLKNIIYYHKEEGIWEEYMELSQKAKDIYMNKFAKTEGMRNEHQKTN